MSFSITSISEIETLFTKAVDNIVRRIDSYIITGNNVPKKTGNLQESGRKNLRLSVGGLDFSINLNFDVSYAKEVNDRTNFFIPLEEYAKRVTQQEFLYFLNTSKITTTVMIV